MNLLLVWVSTIVLSYAMDLIKDASLIKRVVESGYKVDLDKYNKKMKAFQSINSDTESLFPEEEKSDEDRTEITIDYVERILNEYRKIRDDILDKKEEMSRTETIEEETLEELIEEEKGPTKKL